MTLPLWNPFATERHVLLSDLSSEECLKRLRQQRYNFWTSANPYDSPVYGSVRSKRFLLVHNVMSQNGYTRRRNAFAPVARGSVTATPTGAKITVTLSLNPFLLPFIVAWPIGLIILTLLPVFVHFQSRPTWGVWFTVAALLLSFWIGLYTFGRRSSRTDGPFLLAFVQQTLLAKEAVGTQQPS